MLATELALCIHIAFYYTLYIFVPFMLTTIYLILTFVDNVRQLNLPHGTSMIENGRSDRVKVKNEL